MKKQCIIFQLQIFMDIKTLVSEITATLTSKIVKPSFFCSVMLNTIQMLFSVMHVVLKGPVAVVTVVPLPHGQSFVEVLQYHL